MSQELPQEGACAGVLCDVCIQRTRVALEELKRKAEAVDVLQLAQSVEPLLDLRLMLHVFEEFYSECPFTEAALGFTLAQLPLLVRPYRGPVL